MNAATQQTSGPLPFDTAAIADALLGRDLPAAAEAELRLAGVAYQRDAEAEQHLFRARALAPDHPAVLIGFYRFYFYKSRLEDALVIARLCLLRAARDNALIRTGGGLKPRMRISAATMRCFRDSISLRLRRTLT